MTDKKTVQATKVSASWTPLPPASEAMVEVLRLPVGTSIAGGRIRITMALAADHSSTERVMENARYLEVLKTDLEARGTIHSWTVSAGAVPKDEVYDLMTTDADQPVKEAAE